MIRPCACGSEQPRFAMNDAAGIFLTYACEACENEKKSKYNPAIFDENSTYAQSGEEEDIWEEEPWDDRELDGDDRSHFADPGGHSALRASSPSNPRNLPCPTCRAPNRLTPADRDLGYQCDACADKAERGWD